MRQLFLIGNFFTRTLGVTLVALLMVVAPVRAEETYVETHELLEYCTTTNKQADVKQKPSLKSAEIGIHYATSLPTRTERTEAVTTNQLKLFILYHELKLCD